MLCQRVRSIYYLISNNAYSCSYLLNTLSPEADRGSVNRINQTLPGGPVVSEHYGDLVVVLFHFLVCLELNG